MHGHVADLAEDVEVGGEGGDGAVEEHQVLDEEHELLRHAGADAEQRLDRLLDLVDELVGVHRGGVDHRLVEPEVRDHRVEVGVGREGAEVAQRRELAADVVGGGGHEQAEEGQAPRLGQAADDAEVEQGGAAVGEHEQVPAVEVAVEDAVDHGALHEPDHPGADDGLGVDAGVAHAGHVVELEALEALHHEHPRGDQLGVGPGDHVVPLAELARTTGPRRACSAPRCGSRAPR